MIEAMVTPQNVMGCKNSITFWKINVLARMSLPLAGRANCSQAGVTIYNQ